VRFVANTEFVHTVKLIPEILPGHDCSVGSKRVEPELFGLSFGDPKTGADEFAIREFGLQLGKHVRKDQRFHGQVSLGNCAFFEYFVTLRLEKSDRLLAF
jgi:hypothetical protein